VLWPTIAWDGKSILFERDFGIWRYDVASGETRAVPITLRGAPAGAATEHVTLTSGFQEMSLSPDGKKVALVARGEVFAASSKDGGDAVRVSATPSAEGQLAWAPDSRRLVYASDRDGTEHLFLYDFGTRTETQLTRGAAGPDIAPHWSPDGKQLAYVRAGRELRVMDMATKQDRVLATGDLDRPPFVTDRALAWSPDGRWIAYSSGSGTRLFTNAFVVPVAGGESRQVSWLPHVFGGSLAWSPDGAFLLISTGQRTEQGQIARVDLVPRTPKFREDQFRDLFAPEVPRPGSPPAQQPSRQAPSDSIRDTATAGRDSSARGGGSPNAKRTEIVFTDIRRRLSFLPVGLDAGSPVISPDGKQVAFPAGAAGQTNIYMYSLDELAREQPVARQLTSTAGFKSDLHWSPDSKEIYYLERGRLSSVTAESRAVRGVSVTAELDVDFTAEKREVLAQVYTVLRDNFYDEKMHGVDWSGIRDAYEPHANGARTSDELRRVLNLMIGELNASHSGMQAGAAQQPFTGRLGVRYDRTEYERTGKLKIAEIVPLGAMALAGGVAVGDYVTAIDGRSIDARTNVDSILAYRTNRQTRVTITSGGRERTVTVRPTSGGTEKGLLYRAWVEERRAYVARISNGRLGYVHMFDMGQGSLNQLYADLDAENTARDGVVIDIRNNNGGFVNAYALDVFARRPYLTMQPRGRGASPARSQLGQRSLELPTVLVTNQHSLSDAEDFTEGYRTMKLGKVVGEPTAGWIIYTSSAGLVDGSSVRLPFIKITDANGQNMELKPRPVDVEVTRPIGESYTGKDSQLDAAVKELLAQLGAGRKISDR
jgi:tricorn protease